MQGFRFLILAGKYDCFERKIRPLIEPYFADFGVEVTQFMVSSATSPRGGYGVL